MARIESIEFINFRQYKNFSINFPHSHSNDLHIIKAENGTGKTTLLNAICWCLYGEEKYIVDKEQSLKILNTDVLKKSHNGDIKSCKVTLKLIDEDKTFFFERTTNYKVICNLFDEISCEESDKTFVIKKIQNGIANTEEYDDESQTSLIVKQYFDKDIFNYYFFNGEDLKDYFNKNKGEKIKNSIHNISQVSLLNIVGRHIDDIRKSISKKIDNFDNSENLKIYDEIREHEKSIKNYNEQRSDALRNVEILKARISELESLLSDYKPVKKLQEEREEFNKKVKKLESDLEIVNEEIDRFIIKYTKLLCFYPSLNESLKYINDCEKNGKLPATFDYDLIKRIIDEHIKNCPYCGSTITEESLNHLEDLLNNNDNLTNKTGKLLSEIKFSLESLIEECKKYNILKSSYFNKKREIEDEIEECSNELRRINSDLINYGNDGTLNVKDIENERNIKNDSLILAEGNIVYCDNNLNTLNKELEELNKKRIKFENELNSKNEYSSQIKILSKLDDSIKTIKEEILKNLFNELTDKTNNQFKKMIWKEHTFGNISITENYEIKVFNEQNTVMNGSMSATELMALAYAYTLAIHDVSGRNSPLVIDSPLGRTSDKNRKKIISSLLNVSKNKQIIMLFTGDEYSEQVKNICENNVSSFKTLTLNNEETDIVED